MLFYYYPLLPDKRQEKVNSLPKVTSLYVKSQNLNHYGTKQRLSIRGSNSSSTVKCRVTLDKSPTLSETQFPSLRNGIRVQGLYDYQKHTMKSIQWSITEP